MGLGRLVQGSKQDEDEEQMDHWWNLLGTRRRTGVIAGWCRAPEDATA